MKKTAFFLLASLLFICFSAMAQDGWNLKKDKDGIKVFSRSTENSRISEIKANFDMDATLSEMAAVMMDIDNHRQWSYATKSDGLLKKLSDSDLYFYTEMSSPWPMSDRDMIVHLTIRQNPATKIMTVEETEVPDYMPEKKSIVRVPLSKAVWTVTPRNKKTISVAYHVEVDPGGTVPEWVVNMFAAKCPFESFKGLRNQIKLERYHTASSFISNE